MRNLFAFIWRNQFFLLFMLLEALAVTLSVRNSRHHRTAFLSAMWEVNHRVLATTENITSYFNLRQDNKALSEENAYLRSQAVGSYLISDSTEYSRSDTLYRQQYRYKVAKVISNSITLRNNILVINKGSDLGLKPDMGVISPRGVVGIVRAVTPNFSSVVSMLNSNTRISAELKGSGFRGTVKWEGGDYRFGTLEDVPSHAPVNKGDTIITSTDSQIFPSGIMIGTVREFSVDSGTGFYTISIKFSADYNRLQEVYIIENLFKEELDSLMRISESTPQ